jgi:hypothetical protein
MDKITGGKGETTVAFLREKKSRRSSEERHRRLAEAREEKGAIGLG